MLLRWYSKSLVLRYADVVEAGEMKLAKRRGCNA